MGLPEILVEDSTLTVKELQSLEGYMRVMGKETTYQQEASHRPAGAVTVGSYYRTIQMGRDKVRESVASVLIGLWLGLIKLEDVRRLFELLGKGGVDLSEDETARLGQVVQALLDKIVM